MKNGFINFLTQRISTLSGILENRDALKLLLSSPTQYYKLKRSGGKVGSFSSTYRKWLIDIKFKYILDVGANVGEFSGIASLMFPTAKIVAFEPIPGCYKHLCNSLSTNPNFSAYNIAVGDAESEVQFHQNDFAPSSSLLSMTKEHINEYPHTSHGEPITVKVKKLDDVLSGVELESPILLKIDVQGYEKRVLQGAPKLLPLVKVIIVETSFRELYDGQPLFDEIQEFLAEKNFRFMGFIEQVLSDIDGSVLQADSIFVNDQALSK